jgi:DNA-binding transcriptional regulator YiaG
MSNPAALRHDEYRRAIHNVANRLIHPSQAKAPHPSDGTQATAHPHKQATTTPKTRVGIQAAPSSISDSELVRQHGVSDSTLQRWRSVRAGPDAGA